MHHLSVEKCGLFVSKEGVLGASPVGIISCDCHSSGVLKIKCAASFWTKDPNDREVMEKLPYIVTGNNLQVNEKISTIHKFSFKWEQLVEDGVILWYLQVDAWKTK